MDVRCVNILIIDKKTTDDKDSHSTKKSKDKDKKK